jgi:hypothetical protein
MVNRGLFINFLIHSIVHDGIDKKFPPFQWVWNRLENDNILEIII